MRVRGGGHAPKNGITVSTWKPGYIFEDSVLTIHHYYIEKLKDMMYYLQKKQKACEEHHLTISKDDESFYKQFGFQREDHFQINKKEFIFMIRKFSCEFECAPQIRSLKQQIERLKEHNQQLIQTNNKMVHQFSKMTLPTCPTRPTRHSPPSDSDDDLSSVTKALMRQARAGH